MTFVCKNCGKKSEVIEVCCGEEMSEEEKHDQENLNDDYNLAQYEEDDE